MTRILVTGATDGIGLRTAEILGRSGVEVVLHGRSPQRLEDARGRVGPAAVEVLVADLADLDEVAELAAAAQGAGVTALLNNAGVYCRDRSVTGDGHETTWAVNHLAPSLLTALLLPSLPDRARVVAVSSVAHGRGKIDLSDPGYSNRRWNHYGAYAQSKLANLLMMREWARREPRVDFFALHPGVVGTKLLTEGFRMPGSDSLDEGAATSIFALLDPTLTGRSGAYLSDTAVAEPATAGRDDATAAALFDYTMQEIGIPPAP